MNAAAARSRHSKDRGEFPLYSTGHVRHKHRAPSRRPPGVWGLSPHHCHCFHFINAKKCSRKRLFHTEKPTISHPSQGNPGSHEQEAASPSLLLWIQARRLIPRSHQLGRHLLTPGYITAAASLPSSSQPSQSPSSPLSACVTLSPIFHVTAGPSSKEISSLFTHSLSL